MGQGGSDHAVAYAIPQVQLRRCARWLAPAGADARWLAPAGPGWRRYARWLEALVEAAAVVRVDLLWFDAKDARELLDDHVVDQVAEVIFVVGPREQWPAVHDDARGSGRAGGIAAIRLRRDDPGEWDLGAIIGELVGLGDLLDRELHAGELGRPVRLKARHRVEDDLIELLRPRPVQRDARGHQPAAHAPAAAVPPPDPRNRLAVEVALHNYRAYRLQARRGPLDTPDTTRS